MYNLFSFCYRSSLGGFYRFCCLRLCGESSICKTATTTNQVFVENYLCDSLLDFSPPPNLCRLVCILLWIKCLDALLDAIGIFVGDKENSTPSIKMRWSLHFSKMT